MARTAHIVGFAHDIWGDAWDVCEARAADGGADPLGMAGVACRGQAGLQRERGRTFTMDAASRSIVLLKRKKPHPAVPNGAV